MISNTPTVKKRSEKVISKGGGGAVRKKNFTLPEML
jgi:hypothetical protein